MTATALLLDLDGTLVDSLPDIAFAVNAVLARRGLAPLDGADVAATIGDGARATVVRAFRKAGRPLGDGEARAAEAEMLEAYLDPARPLLSRPYPGVPETLDRLAAAGLALGLCTNKGRAATLRTLAETGLAGRLAAVTTAEDVARRKPDPGHPLACLEALGARPGDAAMVGDSAHDAEAARAAGLRFLGAAWGYGAPPGDRERLDAFVDLPAALGLDAHTGAHPGIRAGIRPGARRETRTDQGDPAR